MIDKECRFVNYLTLDNHIMTYCETHKMQAAECEQARRGNYCTACRDWHKKDYNCIKRN